MKQPKYNEEWSDDVKALYQHDMEQYWDKTRSVHEWNQYKNLLDTYLALAGDSEKLNILDVGCAQATLAMLLAENGHHVCAVDIRQESLDYAQLRYEHGQIRFLQGNALELDINEKFDLIFANQIIEHLVYPGILVEGLKRLLNKGGRLVVSTPNWEYFKNSLPSFSELGNPKELEDRQFTADGDGHFFAYKATELVDIFESAGLGSDLKTVVFETPFLSGHVKFRYLHKLLPYWVLKFFDKLILKIPKFNSHLSHQIMIIGRT